MLYKNILFFLFVLSFVTCGRSGDVLKNEIFSISLNETKTGVASIEYAGQNLLASGNAGQPLFNLRFRDRNEGGRIVEFDATKASVIHSGLKKNEWVIEYSGFEGVDLSARVCIRLGKGERLSAWHIEVDNGTPYYLDHIDFPNLAVRNDLTATGGSGRIFWPFQEGCLVEDVRIREQSWLRYRPVEYPLNGGGGQYPNCTQMQFMAYYNDGGGLYLATHDARSHPKGFDFYRVNDDAIKLDLRLFAGGAVNGIFSLPYSVMVGVFDGDWHDAADIYRDWVENAEMPLPPKIAANDELPDWFFSSPVMLSYPVRGTRDLGDMTPNKLFPYLNAIPHIERYAEAFGSRIMVLLMHWEGSAPWAPPYVWPPYGGEKLYNDFVSALHEKGNLVGLYASGTGYTLRSNTDSSYNMMDEYERKGLARVMKVAPDGTLATNGKCSGEHGQRIGYDMCPTNNFVKKVVAEEITKILSSQTDYVQYFDQNDGGGAFHCYGTEHGHSYGPGLWLTEDMAAIYDTCRTIIRRSGTKLLIGTESAAAEPFIQYLLLNDLRSHNCLSSGRPVPAYAYVYHEYVNNFMGVQHTVRDFIENAAATYPQRIAYSFCAGDLMTISIRDDGEMVGGWNVPWTEPGPDRQQMIRLINNLSGWRQGVAKDYLISGRMLKPLPLEGVYKVPMIAKSTGGEIPFESVLTSNWLLQDGHKAQISVNYLTEKQTVTVDASGCKDVCIHFVSDQTVGSASKPGKIEVAIEPLSAVMVSYR